MMLRVLLASLVLLSARRADAWEIPRGTDVTPDGVLAPGEWDDAREIVVHVEPAWPVVVRLKHAGTRLLALFAGLDRHAIDERHPELLLDGRPVPGAAWGPQTWWLHASYNDCDFEGGYGVKEAAGTGTCSPEKAAWKANNFPLSAPAVVDGRRRSRVARHAHG